ncbi:MAG: hypothetical protein JJ920_07610 [Roseitalea sp.]|nr:hypothetical protein [Roseitalea sp.]MBO6720402.1 hypothetical protein [Roseitalea sp.]MBO6742762.1 hypothetical protein [Roseitalea sp.]
MWGRTGKGKRWRWRGRGRPGLIGVPAVLLLVSACGTITGPGAGDGARMTTAYASSSTAPATSASDQTRQGWSADQQRFWAHASGGSRLIPQTWWRALEQDTGREPFFAPAAMERYGFLRSGQAGDLPIGFAVDRQSDSGFALTGLRWYRDQKRRGRKVEPWVGFNCAACHTARLHYRGQSQIVLGAPAMIDFEAFIRGLDRALRATGDNPDKWNRFASRVLGSRDSADNRLMLEAAIDSVRERLRIVGRLDRGPLHHGHGRTDAFGHIFNTLAYTANRQPPLLSALDAPVNYPHLWNAHRQRFTQWNGAARNAILPRRDGRATDFGAWGRNAGSLIGTFAEVVPDRPGQTGIGFHSSLNIQNIREFEAQLTDLEPPAWPSAFPPIDAVLARRGAALYEEHCAACHRPQSAAIQDQPNEMVLHFNEIAPQNRTDIWMACNAFAQQVATGSIGGLREHFFKGRPLSGVAPGASVLKATVIAVLAGRFESLSGALPSIAGTVGSQARLSIDMAQAQLAAGSRQERENACLASDHPFLAYKARPLDGIWATAPYLHNGSVPTLYDLLLPAADRPQAFVVGSGAFDADKIGIDQTARGGSHTVFRTHDDAGQPIPGNSNHGHEYGVYALHEADRMALIEYVKGL